MLQGLFHIKEVVKHKTKTWMIEVPFMSSWMTFSILRSSYLTEFFFKEMQKQQEDFSPDCLSMDGNPIDDISNSFIIMHFH